MDDVKVISTEPITKSRYIQPMRVNYTQNGKEKIWDYFKALDSVAIIIFNSTSQSLILVRQFRPAVYMNLLAASKSNKDQPVPGSEGLTYELCAGLVDRDDPVDAIACGEVLEETGYRVTPDQLELVTVFRSGVGLAGNRQHLYYVEVTDDMKVSSGGGCAEEGEMIELYNLKLSEVKPFIEDKTITNRPSGLLFGLSWFLSHKT